MSHPGLNVNAVLPIVLVPGLLCSDEVWAPQQSALWPHTSVQIASTLQGRSMAQIARAILDSAPDRFQLAGISMGGYVCFEILRQAPERVDRLALLDTSARADTAEQSDGRRALLESARDGDYLDVAVAGLTAVLHPDHQADPGLRAINERMARSVGLSGFATQTAAIIDRPDSRADLPAIAVPTLVLVGAEDALTPPALAEEIAAGIPTAELAIIPESGHASTLEQPESVSARLVDWFTS